MNNSIYPMTWLFELDERTTHMSPVPTSPDQPPIPATPISIRRVLATFASSAQTPKEVSGMLELSGFLLETSVVHYEFAALSVEKALQALELMLRIKVDPASRAGMSGLIKALQKRTTLRPEVVEFLNDMVRLRNDWVGHPRTAGAYPLVAAAGFLRRIHSVIAELADI